MAITERARDRRRSPQITWAGLGFDSGYWVTSGSEAGTNAASDLAALTFIHRGEQEQAVSFLETSLRTEMFDSCVFAEHYTYSRLAVWAGLTPTDSPREFMRNARRRYSKYIEEHPPKNLDPGKVTAAEEFMARCLDNAVKTDE